jgi:transcriptional regulator
MSVGVSGRRGERSRSTQNHGRVYLPPLFRQDDLTVIRDFIRAARLASLVTVEGGRPLVSHVPMLLLDDLSQYGTLICHLSRANPQAGTLNGPALVTFLGNDAYVHPGWYESKRDHGKVVPTWSYVAVHAHGEARTIEEPGKLRSLVEHLTDRHEPGRDDRWRVSDAPAEFIEKMLNGIIGVEIEIRSFEAKWKLGQDESVADFHGAIAGLEKSPGERDRSAALRMRTVKRSR